MKKEDFMTGEPVFFKLPGDKHNTYKYNPPKPGDDTGWIAENGSHHCNTNPLTKTGIPFYSFILKKQVRGVLKFAILEKITQAEYKNH
jgi:hypothetical protein